MTVQSSLDRGDRVALMGMGAMGAPMARRLLDHGYDLAVWNRTTPRAEPLARYGAIVYEHASDAAASADVVVTILETGDAVESVLFDRGVADALTRGATVIDMSSIAPKVARDHADRLGRRGINHLDAPVSGGTRGAAEGTLAIMIGGDAKLFERWSELMSVFGSPTFVGPSGAGQITKLANQIIVGTTIGAVAEALTLAQEGGVDPGVVIDALRGGFAHSRILREHGRRMIESDFEPGAASRIQLKDMVNALDAADDMGLELRITSVVEGLYEEFCAGGGAEFDHSGLFLEIGKRRP